MFEGKNGIRPDMIYGGEIVIYDNLIGEELISRELSDEEKNVFILYVNGLFIDISTGDEIKSLVWDKNTGEVTCSVFKGQRYLKKLFQIQDAKSLLKDANWAMDTYIEKKELEHQKKLVKMPLHRLY